MARRKRNPSTLTMVLSGLAVGALAAGIVAYSRKAKASPKPKKKQVACPPAPPADKAYIGAWLKGHPEAFTKQQLATMTEGTPVGLAVSLHEIDASFIPGETVYVAPARLVTKEGHYVVEMTCQWPSQPAGHSEHMPATDFGDAFADFGFLFPTNMVGQTIPQEYVS